FFEDGEDEVNRGMSVDLIEGARHLEHHRTRRAVVDGSAGDAVVGKLDEAWSVDDRRSNIDARCNRFGCRAGPGVDVDLLIRDDTVLLLGVRGMVALVGDD